MIGKVGDPDALPMRVLPFEERFREPFVALSTAWIREYFGELEAVDCEEFARIDEYIAQGGMIFTAVRGGTPLAVAMVIPRADGAWEICKLGSNAQVPHAGAGTAVFRACMDWAEENGARRIVIETNTQLGPALHIYRKHGFREMPVENSPFARADIGFVYTVPDSSVTLLDRSARCE